MKRKAGRVRIHNHLEDKVQRALEGIRSGLRIDGGDVELLKIEDRVVYLRLSGICKGCEMAPLSMYEGIQKYLKHLVPEIDAVKAIN